ncbi:MAG: RNA polymerase sigma factor [Oscillospiraceae bacterium]|nr:RNA polymerase sigma factor [Oscillospiraceae bacterium]
MVYRIALSHTLDRQYSEDIFQEVFLKLFKNQHKIKDTQHLKHWLIRTTINMSISHNRRIKQVESNINDCSDYEDEASFHELKLITEELNEKFRSVILLCWFEGYTAEEAAKILHIREGTVKSRLYRARQFLKKVLEE